MNGLLELDNSEHAENSFGGFFKGWFHANESERTAMSDDREADEERPCLHCVFVELIDEFFAEYPVATGGPNPIDTDEVIAAVAKTMAELTSSQDGAVRQNMIEQLMREIMNYDVEFRQQEAMGLPSSDARH
jgi:hypothetical protein